MLLDPLGIAPLNMLRFVAWVFRFLSARSPRRRFAAGSADDCNPLLENKRA